MYILGGHQTDFARKWTREGNSIGDMIAETALGALEDSHLSPGDIEVAHLGNFAAELFCDQGNMGGLLVDVDPAFVGLPVMRHEAACASGSVAAIAAGADLESGRYDVALVVGVELMRNTTAQDVQAKLGVAAARDEVADYEFPWLQQFSDVGDEYDRRFGLDRAHLDALVASAYENGKRNPAAQTRDWDIPDSFDDEHANPTVCGRIRRFDCSPVTDGGAAIVVASERYASEWATRNGVAINSIPRVEGWGHRVGRMALHDKIADAKDDAYLFPEVHSTVADALERAGLRSVRDVDAVELHDCFATSYYMQIDHLGLAEPGKAWQLIEDGTVFFGGDLPINPSGGLLSVGHPVGATGIRMLLDGALQVTGRAGDYQVDAARKVATLNIGGSVTSSASFVVGVGS